MFDLRHMWVPVYFNDLAFGGLLRTTSRSESENAMFSSYVNKQLSLVEFWMRFECAIDRQRENKRKADNATLSSSPQLKTSLELERHGREIYTHVNFYVFQEELWSSCMNCVNCNSFDKDGIKSFHIRDGGSKLMWLVTYEASTGVAK